MLNPDIIDAGYVPGQVNYIRISVNKSTQYFLSQRIINLNCIRPGEISNFHNVVTTK